ncbi:obscurin-like protein 1 isoform X4 [Corythoichthys intestinalis]|uniref:obscurin-like protein 1 isoform X4 n=1 Tax=Corythoichthys intestinalis TaxID=161448 RepID=UPI0025A5B4A0|nr:obscurin-like protein 1 isoform X4 [Corythoichthys intestinalis]
MDVFGGAPRFLAYPRQVGVLSGTDAVLKCQIGGDPRPAVIWERNNEKIDPQGRYRVFEDGNVYNLIITGVTIEDSGQYMCKAKNSIGETYAAATLKVEGEAQELELREENKPRFLIKPLSTRAGRGEDAVFSCKLWGSPRPEVTWEKDGRKLSEIFESTHFSVGYQDGGWFQLKIFKTRAPDGGVYTCKARNEFGEALAGAVLLVDAGPGHEEDGNRNGYTNGHRKSHQGKQRIRHMPNQHRADMTTKSTRVKMFAVTEGKHAKFRCFVTGKPKPEIIWRKDGRLILSGRRYLLYEDREGYFTLKVLYCKQKDNGVYVCAASNTAGQTLSAVHLSVKEPPVRFKQPLIDLEVWERDLAVLECEVPEDSVPITWYLEDRRLQPGAKYGMEEWGTKRRLTIRDIGVDDDGIYLCEMPDGGRSIAEVAVKGPIMRKLPRKVDVLEGENAAFCVEVEKEEMDIHWYKDGVELRETHQTILKSFGRTHILVFVNTMPQDSGSVTFFVGRSKTSSQLRVKAAKHCPPSCPVGVQINTERANAALLSWTPAQDSRKNPPSGYVLERQEVGTGSQEWVQCLTTDSATSVEILGDSVPCEADYRFRICSVNKYGKSNNVEFPKAVHLVPVARIQTPLQDALVPEGQDAVFTIELSASVIGSWFLNGTQLQDDERFSMRRSRTHQSLRIQGVRDKENGAEITFVAYGIRDSAALYIQAPLVKFSIMSEMDRNKFVEIGNPIVLYCELSDPAAPVHWYKNGMELQTTDGLHIQSEGTMRRIVIQSAEFSHSGVYCCDAIDDVIRFNVEVEAPSVRFSAIPEAARIKTVHAGSPILLRCELSDRDAQVHWYKDGSKLFPQSGVNIQADGLVRKLVIPSADFYHSGLYSCKTKGDAVTFNVNIKAPPVKFYPLSEEMRTKSIEAGSPLALRCVVSDPDANVCWYKDGIQLVSDSELAIQMDGTTRTLVIQSAELLHSGVYRCTTKDDTMDFQVEIKAKPVMPCNNSEVKRAKSFEMGEPLVLECEVADSTLPAQWYKDGVKLFPHKEQDIQSNGTLRRLIVPSAELVHAGQYNCETSDETIHFTVDMKAPSALSSPSPLKFVEKYSLETPCSFETPREISDPESPCPLKPEGSLKKAKATVSNSGRHYGKEDIKKTLIIEPSHPSNSGAYYCATADDVAPLVVNTQVPAVTYGPDVERANSAEERCPIVQQFEISDPVAKACWYKDGTPLYPKMETVLEPESSTQTFPSPVTFDLCGVASFSCETSADTKFNVDLKAEQCHYAGEIGEVSDASAQITADVKAPPVTIATPCQTERIESVEVDEPVAQPVVLPHLLATPDEVVTQYKDGIQLHDEAGQDTTVDSSIRALPSAKLSDAGGYSCETTDEAKPFQLDVEVPLQTFSAITETEQKQTVTAGCPVALQCELSEPSGQVTWYKDGTRLPPQTGIDIHSTDNLRSLVIPSTKEAHSGVYRCESKDNDIQFTVEVKALPAKFLELQEADRNKSIQQGCAIVLSCELSQESAVDWYKDGVKLQQQSNLELQKEGRKRTLFIPSAETTHSGMFECATADDAVTFKVDVKGRLPHITPVPESEKHKMIAAGSPIILQCEVSDRVAQVSWFKDEVDLFCKTGLDMKRDGSLRKLIIHSAKTSDSGLYGCKLAEDVVTFHVDVQAAPVKFAAIPDEERNKLVETGCPVKMQCEVSEPTAQVQWQKDGGQLLPKTDFEIQNEETLRALVIKAAEVRHSGVYSCDSADDHIEFKVDVAAVPEVTAKQAAQAGDKEKMQCKGSDSTGLPGLHEDGIKHFPQSATQIDSEGHRRTPELDSAVSVLPVSGEYGCKSDDDSESNDCYAEVKAPPITFADILEEELFKSVVEKSQLRLSCEVSRDDAVVQWYKDGAEIQPSANITIQAEATMRHLAIESAQLVDSGIYTCRAGDNAVVFKVNIREPPVMIVFPKEDVHLDRHVPDEIILSCELSRPNGVVSWYKDGQKLQKSENIKLKVEGPYRRLKILKSGVEDSGEYVCDTADDSIFFNLTITEPPVRIVSPSQSQMELCQQTSERMVLSCEISRPNAVVRWYRDGLEVEESDNLILEVDGVYRRLIIPETTVKDSAEYVCDTTDESMTFFVNIAEPPVRFVRRRKTVNILEKIVNETLVLDCEVSRPNAVVFWKRNGEEVEDSKNVTIVEDGVARQLTVHSLALADAGLYICDAKDDVMDFHVKVKDVPVQIIGKTNAKTEKQFLVSDDIILVCELSRPNAAVNWYKDNQPIDNTERYCSEEQGVFRSLVVLSASLEDSGEYSCDAGDDKMVFHITVAEPPVRIVGNSGHPEHHILLTGEELILECEVSRSNATVQWLWNGDILKPDTRVKIYSHDVMRKLVLSGLQLSDSGKYVCDAGDDKLITIVEVQELPVKFLNKKATNKILAYENESATLCAIVSRDKANVRWLKDGQLLNKDNIHISSEGNTHKLTINPLQLSDSGDYVCDANTDDMHFSLFVKEMKVKFIRRLENMVSLKGKSLTLRCEINKPKGDVQWVKDGLEISPSRRHRIRAQGRERSFTIFDVLEEDAGEYACESTDDRTSATLTVNTPRVVEFIAELRNITVCEGEDAVFKCVVSPADAQFMWRLNGKQVALNERTVVSSSGLCHMLCIRNCMVSDSGIVTADAEGLISKCELQVQERQVVFTKKMLPVTAEELGEATLEVEVSLQSKEVQWMRQGVLIHPGAKYTLKQKGPKHSLTIHKLAMSDRGTYSCETLHDCTQAQLTVEPRKITIKKGLSDIKTMDRETATFEVELSHPNVSGTWWKNGNQLKLTSHFRMTAKANVHSLTISNLSVEDTATYMFCVEKLKTSARLVVKEPPVTIFRKLEDQKFPEGSVISIECELSRHNVDVKWMKNGSEVKPGKNVRIHAIGRKRFLQITKCIVSDSGMYTCDAGDVATSGTVEVYERELLVIQGLEDLNIAEDQNAVFVCEISVEDVPGEWYKNGAMIHPTSTIKTRQEGTKHFLLMCNVRPEDSGEIKFVARHLTSVAKLQVKEIPLSIVKPLQDKTALEKTRVMLDCTVSNPRCSIRWYKGSNVILPSERFEISSEGCYRKLIIQQVVLDDAGTYSMQVGQYTCSAKLTVEAQTVLMVRELQDVEVTAPGEACLECEVSVPVQKRPTWSLNGETLHPSAQVRLEKLGTVHKLILRQTSTGMSGVVCFACGKAKSSAQLRVLSNP